MGQHASRRLRLVVAGLTASTALAGLTAFTGTAVAESPPDGGRDLNVGPQNLTGPGGHDTTATQPRAGVPSSGRYSFLLKLDAAPTSRVFAHRRPQGKATAKAAARTQRSRVTTAQNKVIGALPARTPVLYRTHSLLSGVAVTTDVKNVAALRALPGVAKVYPIAPKSFSNASAVPLQGAPAVWEGNGDLGQHTSIAIIDTGLDYTHANFGGPGTVEAYDAAHAAEAETADPELYPSDKVIGGYDLVGDDYNADPTDPAYDPVPAPDDNPLDCEGHGSHVGGSAAGLGENADGSTYDGDYDTSTPFDSLRIGPGMAPRAKLYAFKVFGCAGSTDVVTAAIDLAADPNGDGDPSDAVDVINMSLGSDFGSPNDADALAADAAADAGITVSISSGNAYDLYDVGGSPGTANKAITVAASVDAGSIVDGLDVSLAGAPDTTFGATRSVAYDWDSDPDLSGDVVIPPDNKTGCNNDPGAPGGGGFTAADASAIAGKVVFLEWDDLNLQCGSVERSGNAVAAGAIGFVFGDTTESFSAGITGSAVIPGVLVAKSGADQIRDTLNGEESVTVSGTEKNAVTQNFPDDIDKLSDFSSRGVRGNGNLKPDVSAVGASVFSTSVGTGNEGETESGTSMAAPMVAGLSALVVSAHPDWTPEQVKADIMNTAGANLYVDGAADPQSGRYAPNRVGSGRIQAEPALANDVLAYVSDDPGSVSVSFGPQEITGPTTLTKTVKVQNTGLATRTYDTGYDEITSVPGVSYDVSPASVTVGPRSSVNVTVTFSVADPTALTKTVDATHGRFETVEDPYPLETLADASGNLLLTPDSEDVPELRVPVYSAPRPASQLTQPDSLVLPSGELQAKVLSPTGTGLDQGSGAAAISSIAAGLELQATSPAAPSCSEEVTDLCRAVPEDAGADLKYVGITSDYPQYQDAGASQAYIGIATQGAHSTAAGKVEFDVYLDVDQDGEADLVAYNTRFPDEDLFVVNLLDLNTGQVIDTELLNNRFGDLDTAVFDSDALLMPLYLGALAEYGVNAENPRIDYGILSYSSSNYGTVDALGVDPNTGEMTDPLSADLFHPGLTLTGPGADGGTGPLVEDQAGRRLTVVRDAASYAADGGQGLMMVHFHNAVGDKAQIVELSTRQLASDVTLTLNKTQVKAKKKVKAVVTVAEAGGIEPTGKVTLEGNGKTLGRATLRNGRAVIRFKAKHHGKLKVKAYYAGDESYAPGTSNKVVVHVKKRHKK